MCKGERRGKAETYKALPSCLPAYLATTIPSQFGASTSTLLSSTYRRVSNPDSISSNRPRPSRFFGSAAEPDSATVWLRLAYMSEVTGLDGRPGAAGNDDVTVVMGQEKAEKKK